MSLQPLPPGWDDAQIKAIIAHYGAQDENEQAAEIDAALDVDHVTLMAIPIDRVAEVRALLAREASA